MQERPRIDNTMKKPQLSWWNSIDNSYRVFIPAIESKPHGKHPIPDDIVKKQEAKKKDPLKWRQFSFGEHRIQKN